MKCFLLNAIAVCLLAAAVVAQMEIFTCSRDGCNTALPGQCSPKDTYSYTRHPTNSCDYDSERDIGTRYTCDGDTHYIFETFNGECAGTPTSSTKGALGCIDNEDGLRVRYIEDTSDGQAKIEMCRLWENVNTRCAEYTIPRPDVNCSVIPNDSRSYYYSWSGGVITIYIDEQDCGLAEPYLQMFRAEGFKKGDNTTYTRKQYITCDGRSPSTTTTSASSDNSGSSGSDSDNNGTNGTNSSGSSGSGGDSSGVSGVLAGFCLSVLVAHVCLLL